MCRRVTARQVGLLDYVCQRVTVQAQGEVQPSEQYVVGHLGGGPKATGLLEVCLLSQVLRAPGVFRLGKGGSVLPDPG